jgi:hypothetical protein
VERGKEDDRKRLGKVWDRHRRDEKGEKLMEKGYKGEGVRQIGMGLILRTKQMSDNKG